MPTGGCWECPFRAGLSCSILPEYVYDYMDGHSMHPNCPLVEVSDEEMQKYNAYQDEMGGVEAQAMMEGYENPLY